MCVESRSMAEWFEWGTPLPLCLRCETNNSFVAIKKKCFRFAVQLRWQRANSQHSNGFHEMILRINTIQTRKPLGSLHVRGSLNVFDLERTEMDANELNDRQTWRISSPRAAHMISMVWRLGQIKIIKFECHTWPAVACSPHPTIYVLLIAIETFYLVSCAVLAISDSEWSMWFESVKYIRIRKWMRFYDKLVCVCIVSCRLWPEEAIEQQRILKIIANICIGLHVLFYWVNRWMTINTVVVVVVAIQRFNCNTHSSRTFANNNDDDHNQ